MARRNGNMFIDRGQKDGATSNRSGPATTRGGVQSTFYGYDNPLTLRGGQKAMPPRPPSAARGSPGVASPPPGAPPTGPSPRRPTSARRYTTSTSSAPGARPLDSLEQARRAQQQVSAGAAHKSMMAYTSVGRTSSPAPNNVTMSITSRIAKLFSGKSVGPSAAARQQAAARSYPQPAPVSYRQSNPSPPPTYTGGPTYSAYGAYGGAPQTYGVNSGGVLRRYVSPEPGTAAAAAMASPAQWMERFVSPSPGRMYDGGGGGGAAAGGAIVPAGQYHHRASTPTNTSSVPPPSHPMRLVATPTAAERAARARTPMGGGVGYRGSAGGAPPVPRLALSQLTQPPSSGAPKTPNYASQFSQRGGVSERSTTPRTSSQKPRVKPMQQGGSGSSGGEAPPSSYRDSHRDTHREAYAAPGGGGYVATARDQLTRRTVPRDGEDGADGEDGVGSGSGSGGVTGIGAHSPTEGVYIVSKRVAPASAENGFLRGYTLGRLLGEGGFCKVRLGIHTFTGLTVAVKMIDKTALVESNDRRRVGREIRVLRRLTHAGVIKLYEVVDGPENIYVVMEYADGGSLLDYVRTRKRLHESEARHFMAQMCQALQYCHACQVVHRDVKLENVLLDASRNLKLIDFGLSAFMSHGKKLRVHCGSPSYAAPEIISRKLYDGPPVDVWSLGVVLFAMVTGYLPFHASGNKQELCQKIVRGQFECPEGLSAEVTDLLHRMLTVDPAARITFDEIMVHPWLTSKKGKLCKRVWFLDDSAAEVELETDVLEVLEGLGVKQQVIRDSMTGQNQHNYVSTSYFLLLTKRSSYSPTAETECPCLARVPASRTWQEQTLRTTQMDDNNPYSLKRITGPVRAGAGHNVPDKSSTGDKDKDKDTDKVEGDSNPRVIDTAAAAAPAEAAPAVPESPRVPRAPPPRKPGEKGSGAMRVGATRPSTAGRRAVPDTSAYAVRQTEPTDMITPRGGRPQRPPGFQPQALDVGV